MSCDLYLVIQEVDEFDLVELGEFANLRFENIQGFALLVDLGLLKDAQVALRRLLEGAGDEWTRRYSGAALSV